MLRVHLPHASCNVVALSAAPSACAVGLSPDTADKSAMWMWRGVDAMGQMLQPGVWTPNALVPELDPLPPGPGQRRSARARPAGDPDAPDPKDNSKGFRSAALDLGMLTRLPTLVKRELGLDTGADKRWQQWAAGLGGRWSDNFLTVVSVAPDTAALPSLQAPAAVVHAVHLAAQPGAFKAAKATHGGVVWGDDACDSVYVQ